MSAQPVFIRLDVHTITKVKKVARRGMGSAENFLKFVSGKFFLRKRKENETNLRQYVNTNENYYQFDAVLILLCSDFVICVLEIPSG
ncbi:hypothetical protein D3C76_1230800 [compost metagenome]